jgi:LPS-assembly lipoprotein
MMKQASRLLVSGLISLLLGCGYHLRGSIDLPEQFKSLYLFGVSSPLQTELQSLLRAANGHVAASPNQAGLVLKVMKEELRNRVISVGSAGKSSEVELAYYLRFQFFDNQEKPLLDEQTIELSREFFNDQTAVLAKDNEELLIRKEIYKQVARMLMLRAQAAINSAKQ